MIECAYSFNDLYRAAFRREMALQEARQFSQLSQPERNCLVRDWATLAGWATKDKMGTDGQIYTAFAPSFASDKNFSKPQCLT